MYLLGVLEDNLGLFGKAFNYLLGYPNGWVDASTTQPLFRLFEWFFVVLNPIVAYNLLVILSIGLCLVSAFYFFKKYFTDFVSILLSIQVIFSGYFMYHMRSHLDLIQLWLFFIFLNLMTRKVDYKNSVLVGIMLFLTAGVSNYLGFVCLIIFGLYTFLHLNVVPFKFGVLTIVIFGALMFPFANKYLNIVYQRESVFTDQTQYVSRNIADFFTFSNRPWFFVLPSVDSVFYGRISQAALSKISSWNYWLADDYFKSEHSSLFLGLTNLALSAFVCFRQKNRKWLFVIIGLVLLSMPPYITVALHKIYTPGYSLWYLFPMFRVTSRLGIGIFAILLIFVGQRYQEMLNKRYGLLIVCLVFLLSISEFIIPIKITYANDTPDVYKYLSVNSDKADWVAIYPYDDTDDIFLWIKDLKRPIVNPASFSLNGEETKIFTDSLAFCSGQAELQVMGVSYLVRFLDNNQPFYKSEALDTVATFGQDAILYKVNTANLISCPSQI